MTCAEHGVMRYENYTGMCVILFFFCYNFFVLLCQGFFNYLFRPSHKALGGDETIFCGDETEILIGTNEVDSACTCLKHMNVGKFDLSDSLMLQMGESHKTVKNMHRQFFFVLQKQKKGNYILLNKVKPISFIFYFIKFFFAFVFLHCKMVFMTITHFHNQNPRN